MPADYKMLECSKQCLGGSMKTTTEWTEVCKKTAVAIYENRGRLVSAELYRAVGAPKIKEIFGSVDGLINAAGLPPDAIFGSAECFFCGKVFKKRRNNAKYCSARCKSLSISRKKAGLTGVMGEVVECLWCGDGFPIIDHSKKYCSKKCMSCSASSVGNRRRKALKLSVESFRFSRDELIERDGIDCAHCGIKTRIKGDRNQDEFFNMDHIIPLSRGGADAIYNAQVLCRKCNTKKADKITSKDAARAMALLPSGKEIEILKARELVTAANKSGTTGVFFDTNKKRWSARIERDGVRVYLGEYSDIADAISARAAASEMYKQGRSILEIKETAIGGAHNA